MMLCTSLYIRNFSSRTPRRSCRAAHGASALSTAHVCDPPEAFILHRKIVLTMKVNIIARAYLTTEVARKSAMKNKYHQDTAKRPETASGRSMLNNVVKMQRA